MFWGKNQATPFRFLKLERCLLRRYRLNIKARALSLQHHFLRYASSSYICRLPYWLPPYIDHQTYQAGKLMNISLPLHLETLVKTKVESGLYTSASDVMQEALQLLEERDHLNSLKFESLRQDIQKGVDSGEAAPLNIDAIKARGNARLAAHLNKN